jgi:hypothetical protein
MCFGSKTLDDFVFAVNSTRSADLDEILGKSLHTASGDPRTVCLKSFSSKLWIKSRSGCNEFSIAANGRFPDRRKVGNG